MEVEAEDEVVQTLVQMVVMVVQVGEVHFLILPLQAITELVIHHQ